MFTGIKIRISFPRITLCPTHRTKKAKLQKHFSIQYTPEGKFIPIINTYVLSGKTLLT